MLNNIAGLVITTNCAPSAHNTLKPDAQIFLQNPSLHRQRSAAFNVFITPEFNLLQTRFTTLSLKASAVRDHSKCYLHAETRPLAALRHPPLSHSAYTLIFSPSPLTTAFLILILL